jgi:ABC-type nitrate/sulfonate/bicarbonate transport system substrate-binding protein
LSWHHQAEFAGEYVAEAKGYYRAVGLNVILDPTDTYHSPIQSVASGLDDFGITGAEAVLVARSKGIRVVAVATIFQSSPFCFMSLAPQPMEPCRMSLFQPPAKNVGFRCQLGECVARMKTVRSFEDLNGETVGLEPDPSDTLLYRAMLSKSTSTITTISAGDEDNAITKLCSGAVQAIPAFEINEPLRMRRQFGREVTCIKPKDVDPSLHPYGDTIFTTDEMIENRPDEVSAFLSATERGWRDAWNDPSGAVTQAVASGYIHKADFDTEVDKMNEIANLLKKDQPSLKCFGHMELARWHQVQDLLVNDFSDDDDREKLTTQDLTQVETNRFLCSCRQTIDTRTFCKQPLPWAH